MAVKKQLKPIVIEKLFKGWVSNPSRTIVSNSLTASLQGSEGQYAQSVAVSLFRDEKLGHISPGETTTTISNVAINALPLNGVVQSKGNANIVLANGRLLQTDTGISLISVNQDVTGAVTPSNQTEYDVLGINDGIPVTLSGVSNVVEYILWSWENLTSGNIAIMPINPATGGWITASYSSAWFSGLSGSGTLSSGVVVKMVQGPDGNIYITNGQYIAVATIAKGSSITNATNTKGNTQALNLGAGFRANCIEKFQNFVAIGGSQANLYISGVSKNESRVWFWDGFSPNPNFIYNIPDNFINGIFNDGNNLWLFSNGRGGTSKIWLFTGKGFDLVFETPAISSSGNSLQGGVEFFQNSLHIATSNSSNFTSYIYQVLGLGSKEVGLHQRMIPAVGTTAIGIGMCKNLNGANLFFGMNVDGTYTIQYLNAGGYYVNAKLRSTLYELPYKSTIKKIRVFFSQFGTGASIKISLYADYDNATDLINTTITNAVLGLVYQYSFEKVIPDISSFWIEVLFNHALSSNVAAIIRRIEVWYELADKM